MDMEVFKSLVMTDEDIPVRRRLKNADRQTRINQCNKQILIAF